MVNQRINKILANYGISLRRNEDLPKDLNNSDLNHFAEIGNLVKEARVKINLSVEELSDLSKIPISTINAIENNIKFLRPEFPYLRSVIIKLEECLLLNKNILLDLIDKDKIIKKRKKKSNYIFNRFDFINSWQGSLLYFLILILTLFILNRYFILKIRIIEIQNTDEMINE